MTRTGAEPSFDGGGELVRDTETELLIIDAVSDIISLAGVAGRCAELAIPAARIEATAAGGMCIGGASVFGVWTTRRVFGATFVRGEDIDAVVGVGVGKVEAPWGFWAWVALLGT